MKSTKYQERKYRGWVKDDDLVNFRVIIKDSDLSIRADKDLSKEAESSLRNHRTEIEDYITKEPEFMRTLKPYHVGNKAPSIVREMAEAASNAGVGPMASVAGALAEYVSRDISNYSKEIIVENGGDIFIKSKKTRIVGIYAGEYSPFTNKIALEIKGEQMPLGVSTSSGTIGHSLSFGIADVAMVIAGSGALSDAWATAVGNMIKSPLDIQEAIKQIKKIPEIIGALIISGETIGICGEVKLIKI